MATDYGLIGRFNQVQPGGLTQAFRGGVDLRGQMLQNQAQQFANQQAPILADRATQKWEQDLANLQANETNLLAQAQAKQQEAELKQREDAQKFYSDSGEKIGSVLAAVKRNDQIPFAFDYLEKMAQSEVIDPKAWNNIKQTIGQNVPDVGMVNYIGQTTIKAIDQISKENERLRAEQQALKEQGVQQRFEQGEAGKEERLIRTLGAQSERQEKKELEQGQKVDFNQAMTIRKEYSKPLSAFEEVRKNYYQLKDLGSQNNPKSQMAMIYSFMKMLDPGSTVRETEYASVGQASSVQNKMGVYLDKTANGKLLSERDVQEIVQAISPVYAYAQKKHKETQDNYKEFIRANGIPADKVKLKFYDFYKEKGTTPSQSGVETVKLDDNFEFKIIRKNK